MECCGGRNVIDGRRLKAASNRIEYDDPTCKIMRAQAKQSESEPANGNVRSYSYIQAENCACLLTELKDSLVDLMAHLIEYHATGTTVPC